MEAKALEADLEEANAEVSAQGDVIRALKDDVKALKAKQEDTSTIEAQIADAVAALKARKQRVEELEKQVEKVTGNPRNKAAFRQAVTKALEGRLFYKPSFNIYGGVAGLYDYGPPGSAAKANLTQLWRQHFVFKESMLEVECPAVTPFPVLKASGHVDRFEDFMVKDEAGNCLRADHLLEDRLEAVISDKAASPEDRSEAAKDLARVGEMDCATLGRKIRDYGCVSPDPKGGALSDPYPFNLMFKTQIGPSGTTVGYLRPETAQGIFVSFRDLLYYNGNKLPFAAAQIGQSFRNEISPRQGLLRVREFTQAEIEYFVHPDKKVHPRFSEVADEAPLMFSVALQQDSSKRPEPLALRDAVQSGIVANETLAYFIGRTYLFMKRAGIDPKRLRFRQHLPNEMAHYACDRSAYDLTHHAEASNVDLHVFEEYDTPRQVEKLTVEPIMKVMGKALKQAGKAVEAHLKALTDTDVEKLQMAAATMQATLDREGSADVSVDGSTYTVTADMVTIKRVSKMETGCNFVPSVIEPSFGIGRILYCIFEHTFTVRDDDEQKAVFRFSPIIAPIKAAVFPLLKKQELNDVAQRTSDELCGAGLASIIDTTGVTIGKKYARTDELGVPFAITVDYETVREGPLQHSVTLRERDSTQQVRIRLNKVLPVLQRLCSPYEGMAWSELAHDRELVIAEP